MGVFEDAFYTLANVDGEQNMHKISDVKAAIESHKNALLDLERFLEETANSINNNITVNSSRWNMGQYLYNNFWFKLKKKYREDSNSSVSLSINKDNLLIYLEWDRKRIEKSSNSLQMHNQWIDFIDLWINEYDIDTKKYVVWVVDKGEYSPITLSTFLTYNEEYLRVKEEQNANSQYSFRVGVVLNKVDVLNMKDLKKYFKITITELFGIYQYTDLSVNTKLPNINEVIEENEKKQDRIKMLDESELRKRAIKVKKEPKTLNALIRTFERNPYVSVYTKKKAKGTCQLCEQPAPFVGKNGEPYLETHHIEWLSKGGTDTINNTIALCPNCHRKMHSLNLEEDVEKLKQKANYHLK